MLPITECTCGARTGDNLSRVGWGETDQGAWAPSLEVTVEASVKASRNSKAFGHDEGKPLEQPTKQYAWSIGFRRLAYVAGVPDEGYE